MQHRCSSAEQRYCSAQKIVKSQYMAFSSRKGTFVRVASGVPQGSVLGPLLFLAYVNDICRNIESNIRLFADDCIIYRKINDSSDTDKLQKDLNKLGEWR